MIKNITPIIGLIAILSMLVACAGPGRLEMDHGTSYKLAKFNQELNPGAEKNLEPVTGFDGKAAENVMDKYQTDFKKPPTRPTYILSIGGIGAR